MSEEEKKEMVKSPSTEERSLSRRTPTDMSRGIDSLFDDFRRSFDSFMAPFVPMRTFMPRISTGFPIRAPLVDLLDKGDHYLIRAELPGFNKDMVDVQLNKDALVLKAQKQMEQKEEDGGYLHRERTYSQAERAINFPEEVNPDKVEGKMVDGVLELKVHKMEPKPEERMRKIDLK
jgi:HSP20 family protein